MAILLSGNNSLNKELRWSAVAIGKLCCTRKFIILTSVGRTCTIISRIFLSLMVAGKCFVTQYAIEFVNIIWYTFDRIFCSPGIVKLCPVSGSTHLSTFRVRRHLCFDGLKASRTFAIGLNSEIPRFTSHAHHLSFDRCEVSRAVFFYQNLVRNDSLAKGCNYFLIFHDQCNQE